MSETARFTYGSNGNARTILIDQPEMFLQAARLVGGVLIHDSTGKPIGRVLVRPPFDPDEVSGLTDEDRQDIQDAREAMKEEGTIPWETLKAELGL